MNRNWLRILSIAIPVACLVVSAITARWGLLFLCITPAFLQWGFGIGERKRKQGDDQQNPPWGGS
ncbi:MULTISPECIES: hypothetical protein [Alicyclobacillus]|uniref:Uncharacterized protein n=1 Tax=Alicyclobacillus acidocaldarius subsp. acidocaldarius (strain ATCC 27009 / DSM 446 / BCRC 14685 / JCM 5260 / KCTC 1825 / NBRC 15652 / NCIMB 11725 / NRRL B-14509 / 104-IA) TaxID=521098 RepID=C8WRP9_ALIAD|nr:MULTISPECIES: hypothetical protein [Alicyclobacillus]ACV59310.1 hypothetical protein Aaci_2301 [Alicyclobacillus acidocaldarius subsp. acidocaldarius DSM 446]